VICNEKKSVCWVSYVLFIFLVLDLFARSRFRFHFSYLFFTAAGVLFVFGTGSDIF
jgi:hypothetical protein